MKAGHAPLGLTARVLATLSLGCLLGAQRAEAEVGYPALPGSGSPFPVQPTPAPETGAATTPAAPAAPSGQTTGTTVDTAHQITPQIAAEFAPGWAVAPRISLYEAFNDNIFQTSSNRRSDFITYIIPGITVRGDTPRLQASIDYSPTAQIYASHSDQSNVAHNLSAYALATLVEDTLFFDFRGFAGITPTSGGQAVGSGGISSPGFGGFGTSTTGSSGFISKNNQTQIYSFSGTPSFVHRFGDAGTLTIADRVSQTIFNNNGSSTVFFPGQASASNSNLLTNEQLVQFITGSALGRIRNVTLLDASQFYGNGTSTGGHQTFITNQLGYAVSRVVFIFGELGWEDISYPKAFPPVKISDAVWGLGVTLTPDPDSTITVGYGHRYGFTSAFLDGQYMVTARTRIFARYQTGLGTDLQQIQGLVAISGLDQFGRVVDSQTGAPLFIGNTGLAVQGNGSLNKTKTLSVGASTALNRDTITLGVVATDQTTVASSTFVATGTSSKAISGNITWQHQVSEAAQTNVYFGYGVQNQPFAFSAPLQNANESFLGTLASYSYAFSPTLTGIAQYGYFERNSKVPGRSFVQNVVLVGLSKQF
jgi:uncharacterized protein (PEP-CTERM system associated)